MVVTNDTCVVFQAHNLELVEGNEYVQLLETKEVIFHKFDCLLYMHIDLVVSSLYTDTVHMFAILSILLQWLGSSYSTF